MKKNYSELFKTLIDCRLITVINERLPDEEVIKILTTFINDKITELKSMRGKVPHGDITSLINLLESDNLIDKVNQSFEVINERNKLITSKKTLTLKSK